MVATSQYHLPTLDQRASSGQSRSGKRFDMTQTGSGFDPHRGYMPSERGGIAVQHRSEAGASVRDPQVRAERGPEPNVDEPAVVEYRSPCLIDAAARVLCVVVAGGAASDESSGGEDDRPRAPQRFAASLPREVQRRSPVDVRLKRCKRTARPAITRITLIATTHVPTVVIRPPWLSPVSAWASEFHAIRKSTASPAGKSNATGHGTVRDAATKKLPTHANTKRRTYTPYRILLRLEANDAQGGRTSYDAGRRPEEQIAATRHTHRRTSASTKA
jgi:hypothetical protein